MSEKKFRGQERIPEISVAAKWFIHRYFDVWRTFSQYRSCMFAQPYSNNKQFGKKSREKRMATWMRICEHYGQNFCVCFADFICQIDGLGQSKNQQCSRDLMVCVCTMHVCTFIVIASKPMSMMSPAHTFSPIFHSPFFLVLLCLNLVFISSVGARVRAISFRFPSNWIVVHNTFLLQIYPSWK